MNTLLRWNPLNEVNEIQNRLSSLIARQNSGNGDGNLGIADWSPLVDVTEDDKEFVIKAELPEVKKEDVKVTVEDGVLKITGERKFEEKEEGEQYCRVERAYGSFERSFLLPDACKADEMDARYKDGMLTLHVPKSEEAIPKAIEVKVS